MMDTKPIALSLRPEAIPESLTSIPRWLLWKYIKKKKPDGTVFWTKVPFQCDGTPASTTNPATWCRYEEALDAWMIGDFDGIGIRSARTCKASIWMTAATLRQAS